jgi:hypothetical protein
LYHGADIILSF